MRFSSEIATADPERTGGRLSREAKEFQVSREVRGEREVQEQQEESRGNEAKKEIPEDEALKSKIHNDNTKKH